MDETTVKPRDLIRSSFSSRVAVLSSAPADSLIKQYNLNFTQLAQPFSRLTCEASWQDPTGQLILVKDLHLTLVDIVDWKKPENDSQKCRRLLTNVVTQTPPPLATAVGASGFKTVPLDGKSSNYQVRLPSRTLWFETWRKSFLKLQSDIYGSQHEFLSHFVACVLVISSSEVKNSEDVANVVGRLSKVQQQHQYDHPNTWILPSVLKYYLIVQDNNGTDEEAEHVYQNFRTMYGGNFCHLLKTRVEKDVPESEVLVPNPWHYLAEQEATLLTNNTNDAEEKIVEEAVENIVQSDLLHPLSPDCENPPSIISQNGEIPNGLKNVIKRDYGAALTIHDVRRIQLAFNEFISKALLPYMERQCRNLNESIMNRRGMSKSFFSATKRLFGTSSKSTPSIVYASESVEILSRKLGDIYFLFGHYGGAYQLYHQLKKDFYGDAAWLYYSSALELAAISHFMMSQSEPPLAVARAFPVHYVNDAIGHFIDQCRMFDAATRCAIICAECLKQLDNYAEAAAIFIRMTSEDCDLRSALMLEQAAYCFLEMNSPRKYALHCVLAGYRYAKAGLKSHSLNCYRQSYQIYNRRGWRCAEDHVNFTIARLQNMLQIPEGVTKHLMSTLVSPSPQPSHQIQAFYKEFLTTIAAMKSSSTNPFEFFIPTIQFSDMKIRIAVTELETGECEEDASDEEPLSVTNWDTLEEQVVREYIGSSVIAFKPSRLVFSRNLDNTVNPSVPCDEQFFIELPFFNPLKIPLSLRNITLKFEQDKWVDANTVAELELEPEVSKTLRFAVSCHSVGLATLEAVYYELELTGIRVQFQQTVILKGPRLNGTKAERFGKIYANDLRNKVLVTNKLPLFQASVSGLPETFFHAQAANFEIVLEEKSNFTTSDMVLSKIIVAAENMEDTLQVLPSQLDDSNGIFEISSTRKKFTQLLCKNYAANSKLKIPCVFKAPQIGEFTIMDVLILYEILTKSEPEKKTHRVIRVSTKLPLTPAVHVEYSSLKMLDCITYLGLLRLYNLTVDYNVLVNKIYFTPSDVNVVNLCSAASEKRKETDRVTAEDTIIQMNKNESRNIVLQFQDSRIADAKLPKPGISINVQWGIVKSDNETLAEGNSQMKIQEAITSIESTFVFQVKHPNRIFGDFSASSVHQCDIDLKIHSRTSGHFTIQLENNPPKDDITSTGPTLRASGDLFLSGKTSWKLQLNALETQTVTYSIGVAWPGVYNAAPFVIVTDVDRGVQETYSLHSPIIVAQSATC